LSKKVSKSVERAVASASEVACKFFPSRESRRLGTTPSREINHARLATPQSKPHAPRVVSVDLHPGDEAQVPSGGRYRTGQPSMQSINSTNGGASTAWRASRSLPHSNELPKQKPLVRVVQGWPTVALHVASSSCPIGSRPFEFAIYRRIRPIVDLRTGAIRGGLNARRYLRSLPVQGGIQRCL
jgi:hypothetical protein